MSSTPGFLMGVCQSNVPDFVRALDFIAPRAIMRIKKVGGKTMDIEKLVEDTKKILHLAQCELLEARGWQPVFHYGWPHPSDDGWEYLIDPECLDSLQPGKNPEEYLPPGKYFYVGVAGEF